MWRWHRTAYDAAYVALAEALSVPPVTFDEKIPRAHGHGAEVVIPDADGSR